MPNNRLVPLLWVWRPVWEILDPPLYSEPIVSAPFSTAMASLPRCSFFTTCKRSAGQGNIFSSVCQEFCTKGGLPQCMLGSPQEQAPPGSRCPLSGHPQKQMPPQEQRPPWELTPPGAEPPSPKQAFPAQEQIPPAQCKLGDTVNKRAVRILLECNLIFVLFCRADLSSHYGVHIPGFLLEYGY